MKMSILLVDDHPVVRYAVRTLLEKAGFEVIGEADNGEDAMVMAHRLSPQIIMLDMLLPKGDGFQVIATLRRQLPLVKILVLTSQDRQDVAIRCEQVGAHGFIGKSEDLAGLVEAVRVVARGYTYFPQAKDLPLKHDSLAGHDRRVLSRLTQREMSVLVNIAIGCSNKEIGQKLILSEKTISTYKHRLKIKLQARSIIDLIDFARRNHLLD